MEISFPTQTEVEQDKKESEYLNLAYGQKTPRTLGGSAGSFC